MWVQIPPGALAKLNQMKLIRAHDVAAACCLAMAEVRVRLPLGALFKQGVGKSGLNRVPWKHEIAGSNPVTLTMPNTGRCKRKIIMRWYSCWYGWATVNRLDAGSIPATAA